MCWGVGVDTVGLRMALLEWSGWHLVKFERSGVHTVKVHVASVEDMLVASCLTGTVPAHVSCLQP